MSGSTGDTKNHEGGLPLTVGFQIPDIGVTVLAAGHNSVGLRSPVNAHHHLVVLFVGVVVVIVIVVWLLSN